MAPNVKNNTSWRVAAPSAQFSGRWKPGKRCGRSNLFIECGHLLMLLMQGSQDSQSANVNFREWKEWWRMELKRWRECVEKLEVHALSGAVYLALGHRMGMMKWSILSSISRCRKRSMLGDRQTYTFLTFLQVLQCCWTPPWAISWTSTDTAGHLT